MFSFGHCPNYPSPSFGQLVPLFRTSKTTLCAYDRKMPMMIMTVAMIIMMVILMIMMTKMTKKLCFPNERSRFLVMDNQRRGYSRNCWIVCCVFFLRHEKQATGNIEIKFAFKYAQNRTRKLGFGSLDSTQILLYKLFI